MFYLLLILNIPIEINMLIERLQDEPKSIETHQKLANIYHEKVPYFGIEYKLVI